jgi:hypothetical protein
MHSYKLPFHKFSLNLDINMAGDILTATRHEPTVLNFYGAYAQVFSEADLEFMSSHGPQDLAIKLLYGKQLS